MQKFQEILAEAAQLKETQLKNERKNYQSLPDYLKTGLNFSKKYEVLRKQDYMIQMNMSQKLKKNGNTLFKQEKYSQALSNYEEALAIFRYINTKSYDNMKDEDLEYLTFSLPEEMEEFKEEYENHLIALYLNICSCLTKTNKKEDAVHSADQALKIKETAKAYYKKAQAYLKYINREGSDIKVGFFFLNKCYELSKDPSIVQEMHNIKIEIDDERKKEKQWFKFMFDKNSGNNPDNREKDISSEKVKEKEIIKIKQIETKPESKMNQELQAELERGEMGEKEEDRLEKTKEKLSKFASLDLSEEQWIQDYQGEFIAKHGSKIYSLLQLLGSKQHLGEYRSMLAQCLEFKKETDSSSKKKEAYTKYLQWLTEHPIDKIRKYLERYELQTKWIKEKRANLKLSFESTSGNAEEKEKQVSSVKEFEKAEKQIEIEKQIAQEKQQQEELQKLESKKEIPQKQEAKILQQSDSNESKKEQKPLKQKNMYLSTALLCLFALTIWIIWISF